MASSKLGLGADFLSGDGTRVVFQTEAQLRRRDTNDHRDVYVINLKTGATHLVSKDHLGGASNGRSLTLDVSTDGRTILFSSEASDLIPGDRNGEKDLFLRDLQTGTTRRVASAAYGGSLSGDASTVAYQGNWGLRVLDLASGRREGQQSTTKAIISTVCSGAPDFLRPVDS